MRTLYEKTAALAEHQLIDLAYREDEGSDPVKHRLDLFLPEGEGWPVLVFVHGGGWTAGDKSLRAGGADVYSNIGRFYAAQGFGTAVINYRLQPAVTWREQVDDVARAVAWVHANIAEHGGDPDAIFLIGHSAGAQLSTFVALDRRPLEKLGVSPDVLCGVVPVAAPATTWPTRRPTSSAPITSGTRSCFGPATPATTGCARRRRSAT